VPPSFRTRAEVVQVDVVVRDRHGISVEGLRREDFRISEDGAEQVIDSFEAVDLPEAPVSPPSPARRNTITTNEGSPSGGSGRTLVFLFDDLHLSPLNARRARAALQGFVNGAARDGDHVALAASSGLYWTARLPQGRQDLLALVASLDGRRVPNRSFDVITDFEAMRVHLYNDTAAGDRVARRLRSYQVDFHQQHVGLLSDIGRLRSLPGINEPLVELRCAERYQEARERNLLTLAALRRALDAVAPAAGRKMLILLSEGFVQDDSLDEERDVADAARRANAAVSFVDVRGLEGLPGFLSAEHGRPIDERDFAGTLANTALDAEGASVIAETSGGFVVRNANDLGGAIDRAVSESRSYYVLGYTPRNLARDGRFRRVRVGLARKDVEVRARKGYYAPTDDPAPTRPRVGGIDVALQKALDSPAPLADIPLRAGAYALGLPLAGQTRVVLALEIDIARLPFEQTEGRLRDTLDLTMVVVARDSGAEQRHQQSLVMNLRPETLEGYREGWYPFDHEFELGPGAYQARVLVRDSRRRLGSLVHEFEVPSLDGLRASSLVLTDVVESGVGAGVAAVPVAHRTFLSGKPLFLQFEVFGARVDKASSESRVSAGYEVRALDGRLVRNGPPRVIVPTSLGGLSRLVQIPAGALASGEYELVLELWDAVAERGVTVHEAFSVRTAPGS